MMFNCDRCAMPTNFLVSYGDELICETCDRLKDELLLWARLHETLFHAHDNGVIASFSIGTDREVFYGVKGYRATLFVTVNDDIEFHTDTLEGLINEVNEWINDEYKNMDKHEGGWSNAIK